MKRAHLATATTSFVGLGIALSTVVGQAEAQPAYAVRSVGQCDTCHVEPSDWANPDVKERKCSLNCTTCHVSPAGGGLRTPSGMYYGKEAVPMFGHRPSTDAKSAANPTDGCFSMMKGFSGWSPGTTEASTVSDRYGKINPDPKYAFGTDLRGMAYFPFGEGDYPAVFPMQVDLYGMVRVARNVQIYTDAGLYSQRSAFALDEEDQATRPSLADYLKVEELFVKIDRLPYNLYVRAGRLNPTYGWRVPDHTTFVRRDLGFGETRQWFGAEVGINPNYPYANLAIFYQGLDWWPGDVNTPGYGVSASAGVRELGWQAGGNAHFLKQTDGGSDLSAGPQFALNFAPVVYLAEMDFRSRVDVDQERTSSLYAYHEVQWLFSRGVVGKLKFDWEDPSLKYADDHLNRVTLGADISPYTGIEIEPQYRRTWQGGGFFTIGGDVYSNELLFMVHGWL